MELTPIHVRGKRRCPGEAKRLTTGRPPKRKQREPKEPKEHGDQQCAKKRKRQLSMEERLPLEILERIFLLSGNLSLPRCSGRIGYLLSNRNVLTELIITAFGPTWDMWFGCVTEEVASYKGYAAWDAMRFGGDPEFQSAILRCPWMKVQLLLDAQQLWHRRHGRDRHFQHLLSLDLLDASSHGSGGFGHVHSIKECFQQEHHAFKDSAKRLKLTPYYAGRERRTHMDVHPQTRIPESLLVGPFTRDGCDLLFWLMKGGARITAEDSWEVTKEGFDRLLLLQDDCAVVTEVLHIFDALGVFRILWPPNVLQDALEKTSKVLRDELTYRDFHAFYLLATNLARDIPTGGDISPMQTLEQWYGDEEDDLMLWIEDMDLDSYQRDDDDDD